MNKMAKLTIVAATVSALLLAAAASAQSPPAPPTQAPEFTDAPSSFVPYTIDQQTHTALLNWLQDQPYRFASPLITQLQKMEQHAQQTAAEQRLKASEHPAQENCNPIGVGNPCNQPQPAKK